MRRAFLIYGLTVFAAFPMISPYCFAQSSAKPPDLSGLWIILGRDQFPGAGSNKPGSASMTSWGLEQYNAARPPFGEHATFDRTNDPVQKYCDTAGLTRLYNYPWQFTILQTPDTVYILFEYSRVWRSVAMNRNHPKDPDPTWLGDSIGHYEGDTLVVDTIGFNDKTWLDNAGHPHSDALHVIERFRRANANALELALTIDDPKAYTKSWTENLRFNVSRSPMIETLCSVSEMEAFQKKVMTPASSPAPKK